MKRILISIVTWSIITAAMAAMVVFCSVRLGKLRYLGNVLCITLAPPAVDEAIRQIAWPVYERDLPLPLGTYYNPLTPTSAIKLWTRNRQEYGDRALYALLAQRIQNKPVEGSYSPIPIVRADYVAFMRRGERLDPGNALYNLKLARQYWSCAVRFQPNAMAITKPHDSFLEPIETGPGKKPYISQVFQNSRLSQMRVINQQYLDLGILEYRKAMRKQLKVYEPDLVRCAFRTQPTAWWTDDYYVRSCLYYYFSASSIDMLLPHRDVVNALVQNGKLQQAFELLDVNAYASTMLSDSDLSESVLHTTMAQLRHTVAIRHDIEMMLGHNDKANRLSLLYGKLQPDKLPMSSDEYIDSAQPVVGNIYLQTVWLCIILVCVVLMSIGALRQVGWWAVKLCSRQQTETAPTFSIPLHILRNTALTLCVAMIIILFPWPESMLEYIPLAAIKALPIILMVTGVVLFRRLMTHCRQNGIPVPEPKIRAITFWLPVLLATVVVIYSEVVNRIYTSEFVVSTVLAISTSLLVLAVIGVTWVKWRTPDYYAMVNRLVQQQLAWLTVFSAVMAVLLMALEVVTLRLDNTHIGVYKSAELVVNQNKAANRKLVQQVQHIVKDAER